jgi:hypothetical protein
MKNINNFVSRISALDVLSREHKNICDKKIVIFLSPESLRWMCYRESEKRSVIQKNNNISLSRISALDVIPRERKDICDSEKY